MRTCTTHRVRATLAKRRTERWVGTYWSSRGEITPYVVMR